MRIRKRFILIIILFGMTSTGYPAFRIILNNGSEFITERYRISEGQVVFDDGGDTVSLPRNMVRIIDESARPAPQVPKPDPSEPKDVASDKDRKDESDHPTPDDRLQKIAEKGKFDLQTYRNKNKQLKSQLGGALKRWRTSSRNRDAAGKKKAQLAMAEFSRRIYELTDELKSRSDGVLPEDWWTGVEGPGDSE